MKACFCASLVDMLRDGVPIPFHFELVENSGGLQH